MKPILILKTGALGDVLRTTAILPGIAERVPDARVTWLTAPGAVDLVRRHPHVDEVLTVEVAPEASMAEVRASLGRTAWSWIVSLDDEQPLCRLATELSTARLSGAYWDADAGRCAYTEDTATWFDMGLLSVHGLEQADRRKAANERSHAAILCDMLGLPPGQPELPPDPGAERAARVFTAERGLEGAGPVIGLNTGAGGRWPSKALPVERTIELAVELDRRLEGRVAFLLLGGCGEAERNVAIAAGLEGRVRLVDAGTDNGLLTFAALIGLCDLLVTSDSLALHVAVARRVRVVAFFAPTSAAEIELFGRGEKVVSTAPDYCSYRPDADTSTLTVERLGEAVLRQLPGG